MPGSTRRNEYKSLQNYMRPAYPAHKGFQHNRIMFHKLAAGQVPAQTLTSIMKETIELLMIELANTNTWSNHFLPQKHSIPTRLLKY